MKVFASLLIISVFVAIVVQAVPDDDYYDRYDRYDRVGRYNGKSFLPGLSGLLFGGSNRDGHRGYGGYDKSYGTGYPVGGYGGRGYGGRYGGRHGRYNDFDDSDGDYDSGRRYGGYGSGRRGGLW